MNYLNIINNDAIKDSEIAKYLGISRPLFSKKKNGNIKFSVEEITQILKFAEKLIKSLKS